MDRTLFVIADPHLGTKEGDLETMLRFVDSLDPAESSLLFLGDVFHIWIGPVKYHTLEVQTLLSRIQSFCSEGGQAHLVAGNRDKLMPEVSEGARQRGLPFNTLANEYTRLTIGGQQILAFHGDTINQEDVSYLRWRNTINHPLFFRLFTLLPSRVANLVILKLESGLKNTNMKSKISFPSEAWDKFIKHHAETSAPNLLLVGHFHPESPMITKYLDTTAIVVPDWYRKNEYMVVGPEASYQFLCFEG